MPGLNDLNGATAYLGLGGNLGDPVANMSAALQALDAAPDIDVDAVSPLYRTPPWGVAEQPDFMNAVARVRTSLAPRALLDRCLQIERSLKRERRERWGPRIIDLDVLVYDQVEMAEEGLILPHPRMHERAFVLVPLADIAPDLRLDGHKVEHLLGSLDVSDIKRLSDDVEWWR